MPGTSCALCRPVVTAPVVTASASDAALLAAVRSGDASAYGMLYERHACAARRLARQIVTTPDDADDVVAETFARVLYAIRGGNGPVEAFRPYLFTAARRVAIDFVSGQRRQIPTDDADLPDPGEPFDDPVVADLERSIISRAFWSLPERWRAVLWHTEVEDAKPADVAALLGLSANGVSVLRRRAREGLRQAYLQLHLSDRADAGCAPIVIRLGRYVRGGLSRRQAREIEDHLTGCAACTAACADLAAINDTLGGVLAPVVLGAAAADYLASAGQAHAAAAAAARPAAALSRHIHAVQRGLRLVPRHAAEAITHHPIVSVATAATAAAITVPSLYFIAPLHEHPAAVPALRTAHPMRPHRSPGAARHARAVDAGPLSRLVASPTPTRPAGTGPKPTRSPSRSGNPAPSPSPTGSPIPIPTPTVSATARLSVLVNVAGVLSLGVTVRVTVNVSDPGSAATGPVTATITLPTGVSLLGLVGSSSWSCSATGAGQICSHGPLGAGASSSLSFNVLVASLTGCGNPVVATAVSGSLSATGASATKVQCGLTRAAGPRPARFPVRWMRQFTPDFPGGLPHPSRGSAWRAQWIATSIAGVRPGGPLKLAVQPARTSVSGLDRAPLSAVLIRTPMSSWRTFHPGRFWRSVCAASASISKATT